MEKYVFGVDVGGTACKLGLFDREGNLLEKWEIKTEKSDHGRNVLKNVAAAVTGKMLERGISKEEVYGIGMGIPGTKDKTGRFNCPNLYWTDVAVESEMSAITGGMNVKAMNDANAAALGEMWKGSASGYQDVVMVTLGTGIGGGIIIGGKILEGANGAAGEIGGIVVNPQETESFIAGPKGCLEQYASATGLVNMTHKTLAADHEPSVLDNVEQITAKSVFDACKSGDKVAADIVEKFCAILGKGLARVSYVVDPEIYVIGGGVSKAGQALLEAVQKAFLTEVPDICKRTKFTLASLGNDAGMYGAVHAILVESSKYPISGA